MTLQIRGRVVQFIVKEKIITGEFIIFGFPKDKNLVVIEKEGMPKLNWFEKIFHKGWRKEWVVDVATDRTFSKDDFVELKIRQDLVESGFFEEISW